MRSGFSAVVETAQFDRAGHLALNVPVLIEPVIEGGELFVIIG
jgi:hypothetical protein